MTQRMTTGPEFAHLTESEVRAALNDTDPDNPVACEVARLISGYTRNFCAHVERSGHFPEAILRAKPPTAIEEIAMQLTSEAIRAGVKNGFH